MILLQKLCFFGVLLCIRSANTDDMLQNSVDGNWSEYGPWTPCSKLCGYGIKKRYRFCTNPKPLFGGNGCPGRNSEKNQCFIKFCLPSDSGTNIFFKSQKLES